MSIGNQLVCLKKGNSKMLKRQGWLLLVIFCASLGAQEQPIEQKVKNIIDQVDQEVVRDHRLELFKVSSKVHGDSVLIHGETTMAQARDSLVQRLRRSIPLVIADGIAVLPDASLGSRTQGVITVSTAPLRRGPDVDYEMTSQGILGEQVRIYKEEGLFYLIKLSDGYLGWMMSSFIQPMDEKELSAWQHRPKVVYMEKVGDIYSQRDEDSYPVSDVVLGAEMAVIAKKGKWLQVMLPDGRSGWVRTRTTMAEEKFKARPKPTPQQLVHTARRFTGYPYLWGGLSPKGLDCSGLTRLVYKINGILLPRDANMQVKAGVAVNYDSTFQSLQPGDLLFFGRSIDKITHVAMYIGDYKFIHSDGMVRINSFNPRDPEYSAYRVKYLQAARRIL